MIQKLDELNDTVTVSADEYAELVSDSRFLYHLTNAGVDNWEGYEIAQEAFAEEENF